MDRILPKTLSKQDQFIPLVYIQNINIPLYTNLTYAHKNLNIRLLR